MPCTRRKGMNMAGKKTIEALSLHKSGYNCAQAVVLPFCDELGIDKMTAKRAVEGFGFGMGTAKNTCGALSGAVFVAGLVNATEDPMSKKLTYSACRTLTESFGKECGSCICREIKGIDSGVPLKTCDECVMIAARLLEKTLND